MHRGLLGGARRAWRDLRFGDLYRGGKEFELIGRAMGFVVSNAVTYGALGTVLIVQSWLIGAGWVVYGGQLSGRWACDAWIRARAGSPRGGRQPGGEESEPARGEPGTPPG